MSGLNSHFPDAFSNDSYSVPYNSVSRPDFNILSHTHTSEPFPSHPTSMFSLIASASHEVLIRSGNAAYASVNALHLEAKCELKAQRNLVVQLQDVITKLTSPRHPQASSMPDMAPDQDKSEALDTPDPPQLLDWEDYPHVRFWHDKDWVEYTEQRRDRGQVHSRLGFLTDEEGSPVPESRIKMFMSTAKQAWTELYRLRLDPSSWTKKTLTAASYLMHTMKTNFDEFRYCDGDWKVERFAIIKYPDWCHDARDSGRLTRARPSKRKSGDGNPLKDERRRKKAKVKSTMLPGAQVIDLDTLTSPTATTAPNPLSIPTTPLGSSPPHASSSSSSTLTATSIPDLTTHIPDTTAIPSPETPLAPDPTPSSPSPSDPPHSSTVDPPARTRTASPPTPSPTLSAPPPFLPDRALAVPTTSALPPPSTARVPIQDHSLPSLSVDASVPPSQMDAAVDIGTSSVNPRRQGQLRRVLVNPLAGISIRKPSIQVPEDEPQNVPSGEAESATTSRKSGKLMVASSTALSVRNLFAIDYLKEHPMTTKAEFKKVWDNITSETKKKYEALSKAQKSAACLTTAATAD